LPSVHERKSAVVVTATHAEAMAAGVEAEQRYDDEVEPLRGDQAAMVGIGFGDVVSIDDQARFRMPVTEPQAARGKGMEHRQVAVFAEGM